MSKVKIFISYAHKDEIYKDGLIEHLAGLSRNGLIDQWNDREIKPGHRWDDAIKKNLDTSDIVLFLISSSFIASDYIHDIEIQKAIKRHNEGRIIIIPIILRPCDFTSLPIDKFQALPKNAYPISKWDDQDEAFLNVIEGLKVVIDEKLIELSESKSTIEEDNDEKENSIDARFNEIESKLALHKSLLDKIYTKIEYMETILKSIESINKQDVSINEMTIEKQDFPNEFYKTSTGWSLRFNGNVVLMKGRFERGLSYLHYLLRHHGKIIYAGQLESLIEAKDNNKIIELTPSFAVDLKSYDTITSVNSANENELLKVIERLRNEKPEEDDLIEDKIYYYAYLVYILNSLTELNHKQEYLKLSSFYRNELNRYINDFELKNEDEIFVKRVLQKSKIIAKPHDYKQTRRARQRVLKNIYNAIDSMSSEELQNHFRKFISTQAGNISYDANFDSPIKWKLFID